MDRARGDYLWFIGNDSSNVAAAVQVSTSGEIVGAVSAPLAGGSSTYGAITLGPGDAIWISEGFGGHYPSGDIAQLVTASADLTAAPSSVTPSTPISISGSGFDAGETVILSVDNLTTGRVETVAASGSGFSTVLTLGQASIGYHTIFAAGETSKHLGIASLQVASELIVSPSSVPPGGTIMIDGCGFYPFCEHGLHGGVRKKGTGPGPRLLADVAVST